MSFKVRQPRRATAANAAASNPILAVGEKGFETDTRRWKTGDGETNWNDLDYDTAETDTANITDSGVAGRAVVQAGTAAQVREAAGAGPLITRSITDFGAVADGTYNAGTHVMTGTDNTAAINAALASGKPVSIPPGRFYFVGPLSTSVDGSGLVGSGSGASFLMTNQSRARHLCVVQDTQNTTWTGFTMIGPHVYNGSSENRALVLGVSPGLAGTTSTPWDASGTWIDDFVTRGFVVGLHNSVGNDVQFGTIETYETGDSRSEPGGYGISNSGSRMVGRRLIAVNTETRGRHALYYTGAASNCQVDYVYAKGFDFAAVRNRATAGGGRDNGYGLAILDDCNTNLGGGDGSIGGVVQFVCANDTPVTGAGGARVGDIVATNCGGYPGVELRYMPNSRCGNIQINGHSGDWGGASHYGALIWNSPNTRQPTMVFADGFGAAGLNDATLVPLRVEASTGCYDGRVTAHADAVFTATPTYDTASGNAVRVPVDQTKIPDRVYGTAADGTQRTYDISVSSLAAAVARRTAESNLVADAFIPGMVSTATAAGTTTLTVDSVEVQRFTGTTTQTVTLPTTGVTAGRLFEFINDSTGVVTVNSSDSSLVVAMPAGTRAQVRATTATPTTPSHWTLFVSVDRTSTANRVYGTGSSGEQRSYDISVNALAGAVARLTGEANLRADAFIPGLASTPTAAGTTPLTVDSVEIQVFTGTTTQTVTLPTTSILAGHRYTLINNSTGAVTVNASGGGLVVTLAAGERKTVVALQATPTTAAHWAVL